MTVADLAEEDTILQLGLVPNRIDLLAQVECVEFGSCWNRHRTIEADGVPLPVIALPDLTINKRAVGRKEDEADIETLGG